MIGEADIIVKMSAKDAELFVKFRRFQNAFEMLAEHNAVDIKNGSVTMNFDKFGTLRNIQVINNYFH